ncbi:MAG: hypothetical protein QXQ57_06565 [Sulfolobales archaeon]
MIGYRLALELGVLLLILSLITLPFQEPGTASFIVNLMAVATSAALLAVAVIMIRRSGRS